MKTILSDTSDALRRNSLYARARVRVTEGFDMPRQMRQAEPNED